MAYSRYLREKARRLRVEQQLSLDEVAERLALSKITVWYWIRDLPLNRPRANPGAQKGRLAMQAKYRKLREDAYLQGWIEFDGLIQLPTFRDFVVLYIAEGSKRNRNRVSVGNSDPRVVALSAGWLAHLPAKRLTYSLQYHADQDLDELRAHWGTVLEIDGADIRMQRKSNSGNLAGRTWRSAYGVLSVDVSDILLRARLQAWMDRVRADWALDSCSHHGA